MKRHCSFSATSELDALNLHDTHGGTYRYFWTEPDGRVTIRESFGSGSRDLTDPGIYPELFTLGWSSYVDEVPPLGRYCLIPYSTHEQ